jgi:hypothetical protein
MTRNKFSLVLAGAFVVSAMLASSPLNVFGPATAVAETTGAPARWIGFYQPGAPQSVAPLAAVEGKLGLHVKVTNFFRSIEQRFTDHEVANATARGSIPLITLEVCKEGASSDVTQSDYSLKRIADGQLDSVWRTYAQEAKDNGHEVWIRPFHEMNGFWYPWCGTTNGNTPAEFLRAWRHVHDIFVSQGATNVKFVWCPNVESLSKNSSGGMVIDAPGNRIADYYPGDAYVDYVALDGYNFSTTVRGVKWRSFTSIFAKPYDEVCTITPKPIFVAETASVSCGGSKAAWIADMFRVIPARFPRIVGVSWYNSGNSSQDWPVDSSSVALQSFRRGVANGTYSPGLQLGRVRTGISIKKSAKTVKRRHKIKLSGLLTPGQYHDRIRVNVTIPRHRPSHRDVLTNGSAGWSMTYTPTVRGTYYVRATYAGDSNRLSGSSKTIKFVVK